MDVHVAQVFDALRRPHQCATVQLDFVQVSSATCHSSTPLLYTIATCLPPPPTSHLPLTCATCPQPERFDLKYMSSGGDKEGYERPVMIHRAIMGSFERMIAILTEHYAGKWPLFLSPRQAIGPE